MKMIRSSAIIRRQSAFFAQNDRMVTSSSIIRRHSGNFGGFDRMMTSSSIIRHHFAVFTVCDRKIRSSGDHLHHSSPLHALLTRLFCRLHALLLPPYTPLFTPYSCPLFARPPNTPIGMNPARGRFCHD